MKRTILMAVVCLPLLTSAQYVSKVWSPENGDGTYTNPVINADYSDPDVCVGASGEDYSLGEGGAGSVLPEVRNVEFL